MGINRSFSKKLIVNILTVITILFVLTIVGIAFISGAILTKEATRSAENELNASINDIGKHIENVENITQNYAYLAYDHLDNKKFLTDLSRKMVQCNKYVYGVCISLAVSDSLGTGKFAPYFYTDSLGVIHNHNLEDKCDYWKLGWFTIPFNTGEAVWSEPYFDYSGGYCWMSTYSYPIKNEQGEILAIIAADLPLAWIKRKTDMIHPYEHSFATLISKEGYLLSDIDDSQKNGQTVAEWAGEINNPKLTQLINSMMAGETGSIIIKKDKKNYFAVYGPFKNGWSMSITNEYSEVLDEMDHVLVFSFIIAFIALIIMIIICDRKIRRITQPLTEFSVSAMNMAKGNFNAQLPEIKSEDEMRRLHDSLAYMQKTINTYIRELRTTTSYSERMESELNIARNIQLGMLPKNFPNSDLCRIHAMMTPAKEVGGDLYDFAIDDDYLYFTIGDVSGKGVPASLFMAIILSAMRFFYGQDFPMKRAVELVNQNVSYNNDNGMFCTFFSARLNLKTHQLIYCNAGHNPMIIIPGNPSEKPYFHKPKTNLALGLIEDFSYEEECIDLTPGTRLVLYTDGVSEAETRKKELFGDDRLLEVVSTDDFRKLNPEGMVNAIYTAVKTFTNNIEANDDITLLVVEI